jgi:hypothetical protein
MAKPQIRKNPEHDPPQAAMTRPPARYVPDRVSHSGDSRSLADRQPALPQISDFAGSLPRAAETSQADSPRLQFGLQVTIVQRRASKTGQGHRSRLNRPGLPCPELLMRLGSWPRSDP